MTDDTVKLIHGRGENKYMKLYFCIDLTPCINCDEL